MTRLSVFLRQTAKSCSTRIKSKILPPASAFIPQKDFAKNAAQYYVLNEVEKDVFRINKLYSTRQGTPKSAYGGLIFSQSMAAAENTVPNELKPHAIHSFFILNGHIDYKVTRLRDGKSFCTRRVDAVQNGKIAFCLEISFHRDEPDSVVHQSKMPECAPWSALANTKEAVPWFKKFVESEKTELPKGAKDALHGYDTFALSKEDLFEGSFCKLFEHNFTPLKTLLTRRSLLFQLRPCDLYRVYGLTEEPSTTFCNWFRASGELSDDDKLHRYLLAYMTDSVMPLAVSRPHFINKDLTPSMMFSLDHNIWIHDPAVRADQWLLYELTTTWGGKSRGFNKAQLFTEDGKLVLTSVQELLIRSRGDPSVI